MGSRGATTGPGRRSHTKSRKGCKTCKSRHIRCDETTPSCNNCIKHEVRCDYLDNLPPSPRLDDGKGYQSQPSTSATPLYHSPPADNIDYSWQQMHSRGHSHQPSFDDSASFVSQDAFVPPAQLSATDLHYHRHLDTVCDAMSMKGVTDLTMWTAVVPRFLNLASAHPFVMNAVLSFATNHVAWTTKSTDVRQLSFEYGSLALSGLHDAIASFSKDNSDAALAASILLVVQTTDWRTWSSLSTGIKSVSAAMDSWKHESLFADIMKWNSPLAPEVDPETITTSGKMQNLTDTVSAVTQFHAIIASDRLEHEWVGQLIEYVRRLQSSEVNLTPQQQFEHLYTLRKWIYWVPVQLLDQATVDTITLLALAHLYATALYIGPLYPEVGPKFFGAKVADPLERCIWRIDSMAFDAQSPDLGLLMQFPRQVLASFRVRCECLASIQVSPTIAPVTDVDSFSLGVNGSNMSPFFTPLQPKYDSRRVSSVSSLLEVPGPAYVTFPQTQSTAQALPQQSQGHGFSHNIGQWGAVPSPMFPSEDFFEAMHDDMIPNVPDMLEMQRGDGEFEFPSHNITGGFVPLEIWT